MNFKEIAPRIVCHDGTTVSVQASRTHYSSPRDDAGPYDAVEVGFPSVKPPRSWKQYSDSGSLDCGVYGYVPVELVNRFIKRHGGIKEGSMP